MSYAALAWAVEQKCGNATRKAVLCAVASFCNADGNTCWPSQEAIAEKAEVCLRATKTALSDLINSGFITKQGRLYVLKVHVVHFPIIPESASAAPNSASGALITVENTPSKSASNALQSASAAPESARDALRTEPGKETGKEPGKIITPDPKILPPSVGEEKTKKPKPEKITAERPESVTEDTWRDFLALRQAKKAVLTQTALNGIAKEAAKAGWSLEAALAKACERGWQGFEASWVNKENQQGVSKNDTQSRIDAATKRALAFWGCEEEGADNPPGAAMLCDTGYLREDTRTTGNPYDGDGRGLVRIPS